MPKKAATKAEKLHMARVAAMPCCVNVPHDCGPHITVHHCGTYLGGGRDQMKVIPLCWNMHLGPEGIDGKRMGKRVWEAKYDSEENLLATVKAELQGMS